MSDEADTFSVRRTISGLWGAQPPAQLRPIYALRSGIRDDAAMSETHKDKCRQLAQASSLLIEKLVFKIYSDEQFRTQELGVPPYIMQCLSGIHMYIRKFGQQGVLEKGLSNMTRNAHSQFDILMGITQAHILSFGVVSGTEDTASLASNVPHGLERLFGDVEIAGARADVGAAALPSVIPRVTSTRSKEQELDASFDVSSVTSTATGAEDGDAPVFDDELELSEFLQRRSMEWTHVDGDVNVRRQSDSNINDALQHPETLAELMQGSALNVVDRGLFYITIPDLEMFQNVHHLDLKGNCLSDCPILSSMPQLEVLVLDNNLFTSRSTFHAAPSLHTLWLNNNNIANLAPLAASLTVAFPRLSYLSMMFNPCHPSVLPGAMEQSFRQYRLLIVTLLPRIQAIDAVHVDPDEKAAVQEQIEGKLRLSSVNVVDALDIERLQPYLNPLKMPLPYPGATLLEGTVTIQTGLSGKLFAASQKVYMRLAMSQSSLTAFSNLPMLSWVPYSESRCQSCAEVEQDGLPEDLFETACTSIILVPGFTIGATKNVRPGFKRCTRIDWPTSDDASLSALISGKIPDIPSYSTAAQASSKLVIGFNSVTASSLWTSAVQWAVDAPQTIQKYEASIQAMRVAHHLSSRLPQHATSSNPNAEQSQSSDFSAGERSFAADDPEPLQSWSLRARAHAFRGLFEQGSHGVSGCFATDNLVCASLQGSTPDKFVAMHEWLLCLFNKNYLIIDVTSPDEGLMNVANVLQFHVQKLPIPLSQAPSFTILWEFCDLVSNHMQRHPRSGVLLISANSRNRAGLLVGAYLLSNAVCSTAIDALSLWSELRADSHATSRTISKGVSNKMYQLYLSYFGHFCTSSMDTRSSQMPNNVVFTIGKVVISYMSVSASATCDSASTPSYELQVFLNGRAFHSQLAAYDPQRCRGSLEFDFTAAGPIDFGNVRFELKRHGSEQTIFSFAFHAGFVVTNNVILKLSDVDRGDGAAAEGLSFNTRISIDLIR